MATMTHPLSSVAATVEITGGVDTHRDTHTAAAVDATGRLLGCRQFPADRVGYAGLLAWLRSFGTVSVIGVEGTSSYGAGLTRTLHAAGVRVVEIDRPDRKTRGRGKSDPLDAEAAARTVLARRRTGTPKSGAGRVEAVRNLRIARRSAVTARSDAQRQMKSLIVTAPEPVRAALRALSVTRLVTVCAAAAVPAGPATPAGPWTRAGDPAASVMIALGCLARRHQQLTTEIATLDTMLEPLITAINPTLIAATGVGADVAGQLLVTVGDNPGRLHSEAAFAMLCGVAPIPASSGQTRRHRLNRGGDRQANLALWRIVLCRLRWDPRTRAYAQRRTTEGLSKKEIIRCLKRYVARELYPILTTPNGNPQP
jgi:transposase